MEINYSKQAIKFLWDNIEEEEPDEIDLQMLEEIRNDPDCHEFVNEKDIVWD